MQPLDAFLSRLNPWVPACPEPVARQALVDAALAFCEDTNVVQYYSDLGPLTAGRATYDIDLPAQTDVARALQAWLDDRPLPLASHLMLHDRSVWDGSRAGHPHCLCMVERNVATLLPAPAQADAGKQLRLLLATKPTLGAKMLDDALLLDWAETVVAGAAARLALTPGTAYTSADTAAVSAARYQAGVSKARIERAQGRTLANTAVTARSFRRGR